MIELEPIDCSPPKPAKYECLDFANPIEFALFFHTALRSFSSFYDWQKHSLLVADLPIWTKLNPLEMYLIASNGSGKDSYFIAIMSLYLLCCKKRNRVVVTTKDGKQLYNQTYPYMADFAAAINLRLVELGFCQQGEDFVTIRIGNLSCDKTGGVITAFVTDDPGRAEGYHPFPDEECSELTLILNEAKNLEDSSFQAFRRCIPYTRYICVSSTGTDSGYFFEHATKKGNVVYPEPIRKDKPYVRYVTSYDCPHISHEAIERDREELESWLFDSIHMSRFSSLEGSFCIPSYIVANNKYIASDRDEDTYAVGIDLSLGGDETSGRCRKGPNIIGEIDFRDRTAKTVYLNLKNWLLSLALPKDTKIFVDVGGVGSPIFQDLRDDWELSDLVFVPKANQSQARRPNLYLNAGAEEYFHVRNLLEKNLIPVPLDARLLKQLTSRRFTRKEQKYKLEGKDVAKLRGEKSPDRADAYVLAFCRYKVPGAEKAPEKETRDLVNVTDPKFRERILASRMASRSPKIQRLSKTPSALLDIIYKS